MRVTLIQHGELYAQKPLGVQSILLVGDRIAHIGSLDPTSVVTLGLEYEIIDATDCIITPGFIDPHDHLIGAGGEEDFASRQPEITPDEVVSAGITTVVGCLGTDTVTRSLHTLLAKTRQLEANGISAYMYTGGFRVPPPTSMTTAMDDLITIDKIIDIGEIAISDYRASQPSIQELAKLVSDGIVGGLVGGKARLTHFHTGSVKARLNLLHLLTDNFEIPPQYIYPTHISRSPELMNEAVELAHSQFVSCVKDYELPLEEVLSCFTRNTATVLKLKNKSELSEDRDADVLVIHKATLELQHVFAQGYHVYPDSRLTMPDRTVVQTAALS